MKRSLLALVIGLAFLVAGVASADTQKPATDKKAACCASKSADGAKACAQDEKHSCCSKSGDKASACCPGDCCGKECCSQKDGKGKTAPAAQAKGSGETQKDAACCCGGSCCKAAAA
jgi:hypothetical protein